MQKLTDAQLRRIAQAELVKLIRTTVRNGLKDSMTVELDDITLRVACISSGLTVNLKDLRIDDEDED